MQDYRLEEPKKPSISSLISGIFRDASDLISKEITAARLEMREEMANAKSTVVLIGVGAASLLLGGILLSFTVVYVLEEYTELPLWACYGIVGAALSVVGLAVLLAGKRRAAKTNLVPTTTIENAKEDARWITRSVKYDTR